jgi:hypothetical protein
MTWEPTPQELTDFLNASDATYYYGTVPAGFSPLLVPSHDTQDDADGFYGAAYKNGSEVIIAFGGTVDNPADAYGLGSMYADLLLAAGLTPNALNDAETFATIAIALAEQQGYSPTDIFVTGHSLGGLEAEAVAENEYQNGITLDGATFGAPGLPDYTNTGTGPNLVDYVDYGDPVGNYSSDSQAVASGSLVGPPPPTDHVGTIQYVGSPSDSSAL